MYEFRWNAWNLDHATRHGVSVDEIEAVINTAKRPFPEYLGDGKYRVAGRASGGRFVHAVYLLDEDGTVYAIHARSLNDREKRQLRRRIR